jgi:hypothetical protein
MGRGRRPQLEVCDGVRGSACRSARDSCEVRRANDGKGAGGARDGAYRGANDTYGGKGASGTYGGGNDACGGKGAVGARGGACKSAHAECGDGKSGRRVGVHGGDACRGTSDTRTEGGSGLDGGNGRDQVVRSDSGNG